MVAILKVHIQQTLVCAVKRYSPLRHGHESVVVTHVGGQGHDARVEQVRPTDVGGGGKGMAKVEELVRSSVGNDIGINVDNSPKLRQLPEIDLGKGRVEVGAAHQVEVGRLVILDAGNW